MAQRARNRCLKLFPALVAALCVYRIAYYSSSSVIQLITSIKFNGVTSLNQTTCNNQTKLVVKTEASDLADKEFIEKVDAVMRERRDRLRGVCKLHSKFVCERLRSQLHSHVCLYHHSWLQD